MRTDLDIVKFQQRKGNFGFCCGVKKLHPVSDHVSVAMEPDSVTMVILCACGMLLLGLCIPCCRCLCYVYRQRTDLKKEKRRFKMRETATDFMHPKTDIKSDSLKTVTVTQNGVSLQTQEVDVLDDILVPPTYEEAVGGSLQILDDSCARTCRCRESND